MYAFEKSEIVPMRIHYPFNKRYHVSKGFDKQIKQL